MEREAGVNTVVLTRVLWMTPLFGNIGSLATSDKVCG